MSAPVRKLVIALAVSLGLNLFLLGMFSVGLVHQVRSDQPPGETPGREAVRRPPGMLFGAGEAFEEDPERAARILRQHKSELLTQRRATREARRRVRAALEAEPFDRTELEQGLARLRQETEQTQAALHRALVELAVEADPEQRRRLARWAELSRRSRSKSWHRPGGESAEPGEGAGR